MEELKSRIVTLKLIRIFFGIIFVFSLILFFLFAFRDTDNALRDGLIYSFLNIFSFVAGRITEYYFEKYLKELKAIKRHIKKAKVIQFEKIA